MSGINLGFDQAWAHDPNHFFLKYLSTIGFVCDVQKIDYPGEFSKAYIFFSRGPYKLALEFRSQKNKNDDQSGISFATNNKLINYYDEYFPKKEFGAFYTAKPSQENESNENGSWNFISFSNSPMENINIHINEIENIVKNEEKSEQHLPYHPNGVTSVVSIQMVCTSKSFQFYKKLFGEHFSLEKIKLANGITLRLSLGESDQCKSITLSCESLEKFSASSKIPIHKDCNGSYCLIKNPTNSWDIKVRGN